MLSEALSSKCKSSSKKSFSELSKTVTVCLVVLISSLTYLYGIWNVFPLNLREKQITRFLEMQSEKLLLYASAVSKTQAKNSSHIGRGC